MFILFFDRVHRILMARVTGIFGSDDMAELDAAVIRFLASEARPEDVRGLYDFSDVEAIAVPNSKFAERGHRPPIVRKQRVMVVPRNAGDDFAAAFRAQQRMVADSEFAVVQTLADAYATLGVETPHFDPVP